MQVCALRFNVPGYRMPGQLLPKWKLRLQVRTNEVKYWQQGCSSTIATFSPTPTKHRPGAKSLHSRRLL